MKQFIYFLFCLCPVFLIFVSRSHSQDRPDSLKALKSSAPKIYIDCSGCDIDFFKAEITFVNYVRDSKEAQVHILITIQETASGGLEYTLTFIGRQDYSGMSDTLKYFSKQSDTEDNIRKDLVRVLKLGLMRYVAKTPISDRISISCEKEVEKTAVIDKWKSWVFSISANGFFNGEKSRNYVSIWGKLSAKRITPDWKVDLYVNGSYNEDKFKIDEQTIISISKSKSLGGLVIRSITDHWSAGIFGDIFSSTYSNRKFAFEFEPGVEYDLFPYFESTRRQLRFVYWAGPQFSRYNKETIFDKTSELLFRQALSVNLEVKQPWGSVSTRLEGSHYLHDLSKNELELYSELSLRIFKGLSFNMSGQVSLVHNQLSLPKGGASYADILLQRSQLATQYYYWTSIGLSYTFGSIYSNVVNPRFGN
ncbi:MAG: hypothetical protein Q8O10_09040 [candidate division Zixibacteria bacterium]|nr:hypothetical protein [candidate division Zixibacteria bacterium]